jgi:hypothetical protein
MKLFKKYEILQVQNQKLNRNKRIYFTITRLRERTSVSKMEGVVNTLGTIRISSRSRINPAIPTTHHIVKKSFIHLHHHLTQLRLNQVGAILVLQFRHF